MRLFYKQIFLIAGIALSIAGCSSPPDPPQPVGSRIAINPITKIQQTAPLQRTHAVLVDDLNPQGTR